MTTTALGLKRRLSSLDTMRGVAILSVVIAHTAAQFAPAGGLIQRICGLGVYGVQLFFLISAWTMCHVWFGQKREGRKAAAFYIRRLVRIAPPFWIAMFIYWAADSWQPPLNTQMIPYGLTALLSALLLHSFVPGAIEAAVPGGWSIGVEVSFYLIFPVIAALTARSLKASLVTTVVMLTVTSIAQTMLRPVLIGYWGVDWEPRIDTFLYFSMLTQLPVFLIGIVVFRTSTARDATAALFGGCLALFLAYAFKHVGMAGRPGFMLPVLALALALASALRLDISFSFLSFVGRMSYSVYLIHFLVIDYVGRLTHWNDHQSSFGLSLLLVMTISIALGELSRRTIETYCGRLASRLVKKLIVTPAPDTQALLVAPTTSGKRH